MGSTAGVAQAALRRFRRTLGEPYAYELNPEKTTGMCHEAAANLSL